ncbi:MAG: class I SAM-dependent methyltransferase [Rhodobacteraceae bacterium]|nr:class I SAM-dependent methyltransferase [Paracoccaceae bacterium]
MTQKSPDLDSAYAIETPDDNRRIYSAWAETYDKTFAQDMDYRMPAVIAELYRQSGGAGNILDIGAGTGLVAKFLGDLGIGPIDGTDISPEMLVVAGKKRLYRRLFEGDVTQRLDVPDGSYDGVVSSGTFTLGHVGPEAISELLRVAAPGARFALSINAKHYEKAGFKAKLDSIQGQITDFALPEAAIYGENAAGDHASDTAFVALFRKL